jgi:hypothetical protein
VPQRSDAHTRVSAGAERAARAAGPGHSTVCRPAIAALFVLQILLLTIGLTRDYQLKHEDNNALHATFARSHLRLGPETTHGMNYFYNRDSGAGAYYPNHPPGPGLLLAGVYGLTRRDGPAVTRATAITFHVLGTWLFLGLARRVLRHRGEVALAVLLYVVLPESSFFGRMLNHEVLVLPFALLLVRGYWDSAHGGWSAARARTALIAGSLGAFFGWAGFFAIGTCALHAGWELFVRRNTRAREPLALLLAAGAIIVVGVFTHLLWVLDWNPAHLTALMTSRSGSDQQGHLIAWLGRIVEQHWRYFGLTSLAGIVAIAAGTAAGLGRANAIDPAREVALIFLVAGGGYVGVFLFNATKHDYWQFLLMPASALGIVLLVRGLLTTGGSRHALRRVLLGLVALDITVATTVTLAQRHFKQEGYCLRTVAQLRRNHL